jgi:hypothetical protein
MRLQTLEGKWEEIVQHSAELAGHRVRVLVLPETAANEMTLDKALEGYVGKYSSPAPHNLSDLVEEIWGESVEEKHRKRQERLP